MKTLKTVLKSYHFWMWIIYIAGVLLTFLYPIYYEDIKEVFNPLEWSFMFLFFSGLWFLIYTEIILND